MNAVADLVEAAFELKHDPEGAWILRQMRAYAQRAQSFPDMIRLSGAPDGFVWEESQPRQPPGRRQIKPALPPGAPCCPPA